MCIRDRAGDEQFEFLCLVDSVAGVEALAGAARKHGLKRPLEVLLEGGLAGGRTGCRTLDNAMVVARKVKKHSPHLALRGVEGFEGIIAEPTRQAETSYAGVCLKKKIEIARRCERED